MSKRRCAIYTGQQTEFSKVGVSLSIEMHAKRKKKSKCLFNDFIDWRQN